MAIQFQLRRGTTVQNNAFVGAEGEITVDTEKHAIRIHDGVTPGGYTQDFVTESWISEDGLSWYRKYASGWVEQGGLTDTATNVTVNLPVAMANSNYFITATSYKADAGSSNASNNGLVVGQRTTTSFFIVLQESRAYFWQVSGLGAQ